MISILKIFIFALQVLHVFSANIVPRGCSHDNCYNAFSHNAAKASSFCLTYTANIISATTGLPTFIPTACYPPARLSSACSCSIIPTSKTLTSASTSASTINTSPSKTLTSTTTTTKTSASITHIVSGPTITQISTIYSTVYVTYTSVLTKISTDVEVTTSHGVQIDSTTLTLSRTSFIVSYGTELDITTLSSTHTDVKSATVTLTSSTTLYQTETDSFTTIVRSTEYDQAVVTLSSTAIQDLTSTSYAEAIVTLSSTTVQDLTSTSYAEDVVTLSSTITQDLTSTMYTENLVTLSSTTIQDLTSTSYGEDVVTLSSTTVEEFTTTLISTQLAQTTEFSTVVDEFTTSLTTTIVDTISGGTFATSSASTVSESSTSTTSNLPSTTSSTTVILPTLSCDASSGPPAALYQISTSLATTQDSCATFCSNTQGCLSYALDAANPANITCLIFSGTVAQWEVSGQNTVTGWDSGCAVTTDLICDFSGLASFGATLTPAGILAPFAHLCTSICQSFTTANPSTPCLSWSFDSVDTLCYLHAGDVAFYNPSTTTDGDVWSDAACTAVPFPSGNICAFPVDPSANIAGGVTMLALGISPASSVQSCQMSCSTNIDPVTQLSLNSFSWDSSSNTCLCYVSNVETIDPPYLSTSTLDFYDASCSLPVLAVCNLEAAETPLSSVNIIFPISQAPNILWCYNSCEKISSCLSYSYDGTNCIHYKAGVSAMGVSETPSTGILFSDIACPSPPSQPTCRYVAAPVSVAALAGLKITTSNECLTHCFQTRGCVSWSWNSNLLGSQAYGCQLYTESVLALNPTNSIAAMNMWVYWDIGCSCGFQGSFSIESTNPYYMGQMYTTSTYEACRLLGIYENSLYSVSWSVTSGACIAYIYWLEDPEMVLKYDPNGGTILGDVSCPY